jgi:hypothetical protein
MKPWIDSIEAKIGFDHRIAQRAADGLVLADVHALLGHAGPYGEELARAVLRQQWSMQDYAAAADTVGADGMPAYSGPAMLAVVRRRALYIAQRGSTLNNPHIGKQHLSAFFGTDREVRADWAAQVRRIAAGWLSAERGQRASAGGAAT